MKSRFFLITLIVFTGLACTKNPSNTPANCPCTKELRSVAVFTVDAAGVPIEANSVEVKNTRTGLVYSNIQKNSNPFTGTIAYTIASDNKVKDFSVKGDNLTATIVSKTNKTYTFNFGIKRDECFCHITKISGPEKVTIE